MDILDIGPGGLRAPCIAFLDISKRFERYVRFERYERYVRFKRYVKLRSM